jgi:hypothetical protein
MLILAPLGRQVEMSVQVALRGRLDLTLETLKSTGEFDHVTGRQIGERVAGRRVEP